MPIIAAFFGMVIRMFHSDHNPPHIHVQYGEFDAIVKISTGVTMRGKLPARLGRLLKEWLKLHRHEIMKAWEDAQANKMPRRIKPME